MNEIRKEPMEYAYFANHKLLSEKTMQPNLIGTPDTPILS